MTKHILITDSLFIFNEHETALQERGYVVHRLDKPKATESELCEHIAGKHGYILGGVERVTERVIAAANELQAIAFTGSGYTEFIPAHQSATRKGIAISAAVGENARSVAEYTIALVFAMVRGLPLLTTPAQEGGKSFYIARELSGLTLGIIGFGMIGRKVADLAYKLDMRVVAHNRSNIVDHPEHVQPMTLNDLLQQSDIVTLHVDAEHGHGVVGATQLGLMKKGAILINAAFPGAVDCTTLFAAIRSEKLRAAFDSPPDNGWADLPVGSFLCSNAQTAFNTQEANKRISDRVTRSLINMLTTGDDADLVNPDYRMYR